jgi:hypothetical protein
MVHSVEIDNFLYFSIFNIGVSMLQLIVIVFTNIIYYLWPFSSRGSGQSPYFPDLSTSLDAAPSSSIPFLLVIPQWGKWGESTRERRAAEGFSPCLQGFLFRSRVVILDGRVNEETRSTRKWW